MDRRSWLKTAAGLLVAPAIVRAESIMRVRPLGPRIVSGLDYARGGYLVPSEASLTWSIVNGRLPKGLALNAATGRLSGRAEEFGTFTIRVSSSLGFADHAVGFFRPGERA